MNMERLINMVINQVMRRVINSGIEFAFGFAKGLSKPKVEMNADELRQREAMEKLTDRPAELKEMGRRQF